MGLYGIQASNDSLKTVYEDRTVPAADLGEIEALVQGSELPMVTVPLEPDAALVKAAVTRKVASQAMELVQAVSVFKLSASTTRSGGVAPPARRLGWA